MERITEQTAADIKNRRQKIGVSQRALAKEAGVSYRTILRFEKGTHTRDKQLEKIIGALENLEKSGQKPGPWWLSHRKMLRIDPGKQNEDFQRIEDRDSRE